MSKIAIFMAEGCEEIEGLAVVDILRRAKMEIDMVSISDSLSVKSSHGVVFQTDKLISQVDFSEYDGVVLPGGIPGTPNLGANPKVVETIKSFAEGGKLVAAICAAPSVLGENGLLQGKKATSYPGFAEKMKGCTYLEDKVVVDGNIITSRGMGTVIDFALTIVEYFKNHEEAVALGEKFMYKNF
ncbi:MAG: DJ-1/PfpI family protein [Lachnospiraceae bacterium]|nr:DJ-1/PfpI family protein [Lachnospiraceae bacterium]MDD6191531.1 DJ-1/PfpI family protein [Lachnospiraceae bacterium]MDY4793362.1 DJ-1 family glyoxalase III [Pararoseburia sp.]